MQEQQLTLEAAWNTLYANIDAAMAKGGFGGIQQNKAVIICFERANAALMPLINDEKAKSQAPQPQVEAPSPSIVPLPQNNQ
jgi:hypothetical protein